MSEAAISTGGKRSFRIHCCLGKGGFGEVYRATMTSPGGLDVEVAVKVLHPQMDRTSQSVRRLFDEGRLLARLDHPVIVQVIDFVDFGGRVGLITEYIAGADLAECIRQTPAMPPRPVYEVIAEVAGALEAAWSTTDASGKQLQLIHRDIKPANIRISKHGQTKLLDFGVATADVEREAQTQTQTLVGTPMYMPPERYMSRPVGPSGDVFSLGCVLFEGLAGQRLFHKKEFIAIATLASNAENFRTFVRRRMGILADHVPAEARNILSACLSHDPAERPPATELIRWCESIGHRTAGPTLRQWCRQRDWSVSKTFETPMAGRTITEGSREWSMDISRAAQTVEQAVPKQSRWSWVAGAGVLIAGLAGVMDFAGSGAAVWWLDVLPGPQVDPVDTVEPDPDPLDVKPDPDPGGAAGDSDVEPVVRPRDPDPRPDPQPTADPKPVAPAPDPKPVVSGFRWSFEGAQKAELRRDGKVFRPGPVPGGIYELWVDFGSGMFNADAVSVRRNVRFVCNEYEYRCDKK